MNNQPSLLISLALAAKVTFPAKSSSLLTELGLSKLSAEIETV